MIAFDLKCGQAHIFEAWFRSSEDYVQQRGAALIACPVCNDTAIDKAIMAPNVGAKGNRTSAVPSKCADTQPVSGGTVQTLPASPMTPAQFIAQLADVQARSIAQSTWVGARFADQCRAMHDGDIAPALIHGQASRAEAEALVDDGIGIMPLIIPIVPPELQN